MGSQEATLTLNTDGGSLSGSMAGPQGTQEFEGGSIMAITISNSGNSWINLELSVSRFTHIPFSHKPESSENTSAGFEISIW